MSNKVNQMKLNLKLCLLCFLTLAFFVKNVEAAVIAIKQTEVEQKLVALERNFNGKIGISAINTENNSRIQYRANEHFPMQSTFKLICVSAILKESMHNKNLLQEKINFNKSDILFWSPITERHINDGMTIVDLCQAAMSYSDNTATNLLVKKLGGPAAVTAFARSIDDHAFRNDNWEPNLNSNPKDLQDTTTPAAMEKSLQQLTLGNILSAEQRHKLVTWMRGNTTGDTRIRAGVPKGWVVADKTGAGDTYGISNDIAIIWPPKNLPIIVSIYTVQYKKDAKRRDDIVVAVTRLLINEFAKTTHH